MTQPRYYIQGIGAISPQATFGDGFLDAPVHYEQNMLPCVLPDFKQYINPVQIRRMSRILRVGMSAAKICMTDAGLTMPDGIITATGYGCADDTMKFLEEILANHEQHLTPTHFMQSTYNALSGNIALSLKCNNYNTTYVHRGFSYETGLIDAMMQIADDEDKRFLVGGFDETDIHQYTITQRVGYYKAETISNFDLYKSTTIGTIQGEGAAFITLGAEITENSYCRLDGVRTFFGVRSADELTEAVAKFLADNRSGVNEIDLVLSGRSGCVVSDKILLSTLAQNFGQVPVAHYKHLVGDYNASSSFATWLAARILKEQSVPAALLPTMPVEGQISKVLFLNQYMGGGHSAMLFSVI
jgi:3-oxoacyl-[acyl-carrier-protein] synthase II